MSAKIPAPDSSGLLAWAMKNPEAVREIVALANALRTLTPSIVRAAEVRDRSAILTAPDGSLLTLPLRFSSPVTAPTGGATIDAECRAQLTELLARLADLGMNK